MDSANRAGIGNEMALTAGLDPFPASRPPTRLRHSADAAASDAQSHVERTVEDDRSGLRAGPHSHAHAFVVAGDIDVQRAVGERVVGVRDDE